MFNSLNPAPNPPAHWWQGESGKWYYFDVYPLLQIPSWIRDCNYIFARPRHDPVQFRDPVYIGEKGDTDRFANHEKLQPALANGATELHVNLIAKSRWERLDIETDLRNAHWTPLNDQSTRAPEPVNVLAGLGAFGVPSSNGLAGALGCLPPPSRLPYSSELAALDIKQPRNLLAGIGAYNCLSAMPNLLSSLK